MIKLVNLVLIFFINIISTRCYLATHKENSSALEGGKNILRHGFHRTQECFNFELAFLCIQKCLDLGFDVAYADKECLCTCYYNKFKGKYKNNNYGYKTKWRLGAPTTKPPAWILPLLPDKKVLHQVVDDNRSEDDKHHNNLDSDADQKDISSGNGAPDENTTSGAGNDTGIENGVTNDRGAEENKEPENDKEEDGKGAADEKDTTDMAPPGKSETDNNGAEEALAEEAPAEEAPAEGAPAEEAPAEKVPEENPPAEEVKPEEK